jgi:hypothetical protein
MPWVGFEPTIPAFERAKTVHALERAVTVIGEQSNVGMTGNTRRVLGSTLGRITGCYVRGLWLFSLVTPGCYLCYLQTWHEEPSKSVCSWSFPASSSTSYDFCSWKSVVRQSDSKLLSGFPFIGHGNPGNNLGFLKAQNVKNTLRWSLYFH